VATLRDIKRRIKSVQSTQKVTKAMEMVAAAKLRRAQTRVIAARPYAHAMNEMLGNLSSAAAEAGHPLFTSRPVGKRLLVVFSSDRGLCGSYNANIVRVTEQILKGENGSSYELFLLGRKVNDYFKRRSYPIRDVLTDLPPEAKLETAQDITQRLEELFLDGSVDSVELLFTRFLSTMSRKVEVTKFLPIVPMEETEAATSSNYIFEPEAGVLLDELLPRYATTMVLQALLESLASEHSSRMVAMGAAQRNAQEVIDALILTRNRLRQASITKELAEIVGGAEALN
jgi:F-type H+-transporting ATPase subunit gamma